MKRFFWRNKNEDGAVVVEAAISLPVFMFFIVTILSIVNICIAQSRIQIALNETAKEISEYSYFFSLTGLADLQKINYDESEETRDNLSNVLDGVSTVYGSLQEITTTVKDFNISDADLNTLESALNTINGSVENADKAIDDSIATLKTMASDPKALMIGIARIGINELAEGIKSQLVSLMTEGLIQKHLVDSDDGSVDEFLIHLGIVKGFDGIDFTSSVIFLNGSDDIILIAEYRLPVIKLLNHEIELHFLQSAPTKAWRAVTTSVKSNTTLVAGGVETGGGTWEGGEGTADGILEGASENSGESSIIENDTGTDTGNGAVIGMPVQEETTSESVPTIFDPNNLRGAELEAYMVSEYDQASVDLIKSLADTSGWTYQDWNDFIDEYTMPKPGGGLEYGACFAAGTLVITKDGIFPIEEISVGMEVLAGLENGVISYKRVLNTYTVVSSSLAVITTAEGNITTTRTHLFFTSDRGYVTAGNLGVGEYLRNAHNELVPVLKIEYYDMPVKVYNLEVEDFHSYFVGNDGVLVHNGCTAILVKNLNDLPENVRNAYNSYSKIGWRGNISGATPGTCAGRAYENSNLALPIVDSDGKSITYREFDVNNKVAGQSRDAERFVVGSDGSVYYTDSHYGDIASPTGLPGFVKINKY